MCYSKYLREAYNSFYGALNINYPFYLVQVLLISKFNKCRRHREQKGQI